MNAELRIQDRSFRFAVRIVKLCQFLEKLDQVPRTLANQLLLSGISIGANAEEAQAGQSKADEIVRILTSIVKTSQTGGDHGR